MPGFVGFVPDDFAARNPGAHVVDRGHWFSRRMLSWLDPSADLYQTVAARFYAVQDELFGRSALYAMNPFTEGGPSRSRSPRRARASRMRRLGHATTLLVAFQSDRVPSGNRETLRGGVPYAWGGIWNFGGHTTMGANLRLSNQRCWEWKGKANSAVAGLAVSPEAGHGDALPLEFCGELAGRDGPADFDAWFAGYARRRYGARDQHAETAWRTLGATAYSMPADGLDEPHEGLFGAHPNLSAACTRPVAVSCCRGSGRRTSRRTCPPSAG